MTTTPIYERLLAQKDQIDRELLKNRSDERIKWIVQPNLKGWWVWREAGGLKTELLLLVGIGSEVASDDEYLQASGMQAEQDGYGLNYWEGTATNKMPGLWRFLETNY